MTPFYSNSCSEDITNASIPVTDGGNYYPYYPGDLTLIETPSYQPPPSTEQQQPSQVFGQHSFPPVYLPEEEEKRHFDGYHQEQYLHDTTFDLATAVQASWQNPYPNDSHSSLFPKPTTSDTADCVPIESTSSTNSSAGYVEPPPPPPPPAPLLWNALDQTAGKTLPWSTTTTTIKKEQDDMVPAVMPSSFPNRREKDVFSELISMARRPQQKPAPPPAMAAIGSDQQNNGWRYELVIAQQPVRARMCGFGDKDRRPISPPPILELLVTNKEGQPVDAADVDISFFVVSCDSWLADGKTEANLITQHRRRDMDDNNGEESTKQTRNLVGSLVASAVKLHGLHGKLSIFFIFHDLSIRLEGKYRLGFSLIDVRSPAYFIGQNMDPNVPSTTVLAKVITDVTTVYSAKTFPGVVPSTPLSQCLMRQGAKIPVRKDYKKKAQSKRKRRQQQDDPSDEEENWPSQQHGEARDFLDIG